MRPSASELASLFIPVLESNGVSVSADAVVPDFENGVFSRDYVEKVVELVKERAMFVADMWDIAKSLFVAPSEYVQKDVDKFWKEDHYEYCFEVCQHITGAEFGFDDLDVYRGSLEVPALEEELVGYIKMREYPMGKVMNSLRLCLTGAASGLPIADIISLIGRREFARRMGLAQERLGRI